MTLWEVFTYGEYPTKQLSQVVRGLSAKDAFTKVGDSIATCIVTCIFKKWFSIFAAS